MKKEEPDTNSALSSIAAIRNTWLNAVRAADAEGLAELVTDDVVVVHGNGRCVRRRDELKADFLKGFEVYSIEQTSQVSKSLSEGDGLLKSLKSKAG